MTRRWTAQRSKWPAFDSACNRRKWQAAEVEEDVEMALVVRLAIRTAAEEEHLVDYATVGGVGAAAGSPLRG